MKTALIGLILLFISVQVFSEIQVSISSAENRATIGDRIKIKVMAKTSPDIENIKWNIQKKNFEVFSEEILLRRQTKDYALFETHVSILFFSTGNFSVGPFSIMAMKSNQVVETKETNSIEIQIKSVLKKDDRDIKELKKPIPLRGNPFFVLKYVFILLALVALVISLIFFIKHRKQKKEFKTEPILSPLEELEMKINGLLEKKLFEKGSFKEFFIQLTGIVKHFLFREYRFNAEDFTTAEIRHHLKTKEKNASIRENLESLFNTSDLVKFAKFIPAKPDLEMVKNAVNSIIYYHKEKKLTEENLQNVSTA